MPFLPLVLLLAWQALSRSASFALGWATAMYFGQVPGRQGRILSVISLLSAGWVIVLVGFALPIGVGAVLEATGLIARNFDVEPIHVIGLLAAIVAIPPTVAGAVVVGGLREERSIGAWLALVPVSYPATLTLGLAVLEMVVLTPFFLFQRWRRKRVLVQVPLVIRDATDEDLVGCVRTALASVSIDQLDAKRATGIKALPMRTVGFAARHLLGAVVRGKPIELQADDLEVYVYATNVSILGSKDDVYRVRAAVERELALSDAYLTWSEDAQGFEDALRSTLADANGDPRAIAERLGEVQARIDAASLSSEEWNVLTRMRLEAEQKGRTGGAGG